MRLRDICRPAVMKLHGKEWLDSEEKRCMDVVISGALLAPLGALSLTAAGLIAVVERERPFLTQERLGKSGLPIRIKKIRSMPHGTHETMSNGHYDHRRTPIGKVISATRLNETPQLLNVLGGSMSMVGLRPLVRTHHQQLTESIGALDEEPELITDSYLRKLKAEGQSLSELTKEAHRVAPAGWFDQYGIELYVQAHEDSHEARARSNIRYAFEQASFAHDLWVMGSALGIIKNLTHSEIVLPDHNPEVIHSHGH